jgi:hypothetical protein
VLFRAPARSLMPSAARLEGLTQMSMNVHSRLAQGHRRSVNTS